MRGGEENRMVASCPGGTQTVSAERAEQNRVVLGLVGPRA